MKLGLTFVFFTLLLAGNTLLIKYSSPTTIINPNVSVMMNYKKSYDLPSCISIVSTKLSTVYCQS